MRRRFIILVVLLSSIAGLATSSAASIPFAGVRPYQLFVPSTYDPTLPTPLIIALTGYNQSGAQFESYLHLTPLAQSRGFLYVHPDGSKDSRGVRFWNGTPECCDFESPKVDDQAYIMRIIDEVSARYSVDTNRIYIIGHSNGGFLASALACNHADRIAAVISFAGASYTKVSACQPSAPINVLEIWGTKDDTFTSNHIRGKPILGAINTFKNWGLVNRCIGTPLALPDKLDLDAKVVGADTTVSEYQGCPAGSSVTFWKIEGAGHSPALSPQFDGAIIDYLFAHPKVSTN
jgi:polyhydroxybutyrate depolymerase